MNKKTKQIASGILITTIIGTTTFLIIDPYNMFGEKGIKKSEVISDKNKLDETYNKSKENSEELSLTGIKDGTYIGTSKGHGGDIKVKVTVKNSKIQNIEVMSHSETPNYYAKGRNIISSIIKENAVHVDTISGATFTSNGIKNAVIDALRKAGFSMGQNNDSIDKTNKISNASNISNYIDANIMDVKQYGLKDGTYTGTAKGHGGDIKVNVTIKNSKIQNIEVISHSETPDFYRNGRNIISSIIKENSVHVDSITGATFTSNGIKHAVNNALRKAGFSIRLKNDKNDNIDKTNKTNSQSTAIDNSNNNKIHTIDVKQYRLKDGEFIGEAISFNGPVKVKVLVKAGKLIDVQILSHHDDTSLFDKAKSVIIKILDKQSTIGIDTVTGATYSSKGILNAINNAVQESIKKDNTSATDKRFVEPEKDKVESSYPIEKRKLNDLINKKVYLKDKTYETITLYNIKKANAERILTKVNVELNELNNAINELQGSIDGLKTSILRPDIVYEVNVNFSEKVSASRLLNEMVEKAEVKLNSQGKIDVILTFKPKKTRNSFLNNDSKFIIKDGEKSQKLIPEIKNGREIFKYTISKMEDNNSVDVFVPGDILSGNAADTVHILWKSLRLSGATAPESNPLKPGNDYTVFVEMRNYNSPDFPSMANNFLKKPSTISVDRNGVAKLTFHMKEKFEHTRIFTDKALSKSLPIQNEDSYEATFTLPAYNKEGWVWGTSYITAMKMDVKYALKIDWATLNNVKGKTETLSKEGLVSGAMGSTSRKYAILVDILLDRESNLFKDLIVTQNGYGADDYFLDKAAKELLDKIKNKPVTLGTVQNLDAISGATLSSKGIKEVLISAIKERNEEQNKFFIDFIVTGKGKLKGDIVLNAAKDKTWKEQGFNAPTPIADEGYFFDRWSPQLPADDEVLTDNKTYKAIFIKKADKGELNALIATEVNKNNKSPNLVTIYEEKLNAAKIIAANAKAKQLDVDKAKQDLEAIIRILNINLEHGKTYEVSAKFTYLAKEIKAFKDILQKIEVKLNENGKLDITMVFKTKPGYPFTKKGIFKIKLDGKNQTIKPEVEGDLEIFKFTLPDYKKKYDVMIKVPSKALFGGLATSFEILWDTIKPVEVIPANE